MSSLNIIKKYPELLELAYLSEREREHDLHAIFKRDIEDNCQFSFRGWRIYPIKTDGEIDMARLFKHLTCEEIMVENEDGTTYPKRVFEMARSQRLHCYYRHKLWNTFFKISYRPLFKCLCKNSMISICAGSRYYLYSLIH